MPLSIFVPNPFQGKACTVHVLYEWRLNREMCVTGRAVETLILLCFCDFQPSQNLSVYSTMSRNSPFLVANLNGFAS